MKLSELMGALENVKNQLGDVTVLLSDTNNPKRAHDLYRLCPDPEPVQSSFDQPPEYASAKDAMLAEASWRLKEALAPFTRMRGE